MIARNAFSTMCIIVVAITGGAVQADELQGTSSTGSEDRLQPSALTVSLALTVVQSDRAKSPGMPIGDARVILTAPSKEEQVGITDGFGVVRFYNLAPGEFKVQVHKTGWVTAGSKINLLDASGKLLISLSPDVPPN